MIEWIVLDKQQDRVLVLSKDIFRKASLDSIQWDTSFFKKYLEETVFEKYFGENEKESVLLTYRENGEKDEPTEDHLFLLTRQEVETFLPAKESRKCSSDWLLIDFASFANKRSYVDPSGDIIYQYRSGKNVTDESGIRPAMWISIQ